MTFLSISVIENAVGAFLNSDRACSVFPFAELVEAVMGTLRVSSTEDRTRVEREAYLMIDSREELFFLNGTIYPKETFFKGFRFRVVPSKAELENGILLTGARFCAYCSEEVFCDEYRITPEKESETLKVSEVSIRFGDVASAYLLLGRAGLIDYLVAESDENYRVLRKSPHPEVSQMHLSAFVMNDFYAKHSFKPGDALILTVDSWRECRFTVSYLPAIQTPTPAQQNEWIDTFEEALLGVCEDEADYQEIPEQLSKAFLYAAANGQDLRERPFLALDEYQNRMKEIGIRHQGADWLLVPVDELRMPGEETVGELPHDDGNCAEHGHHGCACGDHPEQDVKDISPENFSASSGAVDSVESILAELNAPINYIELYAMTLDALANGEESFDAFRLRILDFLDLKFADDAQETAFVNFLEDNWEICSDYFNPTLDGGKLPLRTRLLELTQQRIEISRRLLERFGDTVPKEISKGIRAVHREIIDTLSLLNMDSGLPEGEEYEQLELRIGDIEEAWESVFEKASDALEMK